MAYKFFLWLLDLLLKEKWVVYFASNTFVLLSQKKSCVDEKTKYIYISSLSSVADNISYYFVLPFSLCLWQIDIYNISTKGTYETYDMIHFIKGQNELEHCLTMQD